MIGSPESKVLSFILENDYIYPSVELLHDLLLSCELSDEILKAQIRSLLDLVMPTNITEASKNLAYDTEDEHLKKSIKKIIGSDNKSLLKDVYAALYTLLHQYVLNKCPDKQNDIDHNALVAQRIEIEGLSREALYDQTVPLLGTLLKRLEKYDSEITSDSLRQEVVAAIKSAKDKVLATPKKKEQIADPLVPVRSFVPAYQDPRFLKQRQIIEDEELAERLAREFQEKEDRAVALALQDNDDDDDEEEEEELQDDAQEEVAQNIEQNEGDLDDDEQDSNDDSSDHSQSEVRRVHP